MILDNTDNNVFGKVFVVFLEYFVVFKDLFVVFADIGHRKIWILSLKSFVPRSLVIHFSFDHKSVIA